MTPIPKTRSGFPARVPVSILRMGEVKTAGLPRWVSGTLASLAISGQAVVIFDLGDDFEQYSVVQISIKGTAALAGIAEDSSDDGVTKHQSLIATNGSAMSLVLSAAGETTGVGMVSGRYLILTLTNGATAQGAGAMVRVVLNP
jgi:hypothetical protein